MVQKPDQMRGKITLILLLVIGFGIGFLIKRVHIGLLIGLALGLLSSGLLRKR